MADTPPPGAYDDRADGAESLSEPLLPGNGAPLKLAGAHRRLQQLLAWSSKRNWKRIATIAFPLSVFTLLILVSLKRRASYPAFDTPETSLLVTLPSYGTFRGFRLQKDFKDATAHHVSVDAWLGIEYSIQPTKEDRFSPPNWPKRFEGVKDAKQYGAACMQQGWYDGNAETCLKFNLHRPSGVPFKNRLPVLVWLHGGAFVGGAGGSFDGATFVARSKEPLIVVTVQYRLGALGSLPSKLFAEEGLLNLGIRDQRMLLEFLQTYIQFFGGDPDRVTLGGQSAGAHSVGLHLFHNYGDDKDRQLFSQAIIASGAPTARSFPPATYPLYQEQFKQFMNYVNCDPSLTNEQVLSCLRAVPLGTIQKYSSKMFKETRYNITWPWQPVSPGPLIEKLGSQSGVDGTFYKIPLLISSTTDEGKFFAPKDLITDYQFNNFIKNLLPGLNGADLRELEELYPTPSQGMGPYAGSTVSLQFERISALFGDYSYICPVQETAYRLAKAGAPVYKSRFNAPNGDDGPMGVPHASDAPFFNGNPNVRHPEISNIYSSYYASFVVSGDPNRFAVKEAPTWDRYTGLGNGTLVVGSKERGGILMEEEGKGIRMRECAWWRDEARMLRLYK